MDVIRIALAALCRRWAHSLDPLPPDPPPPESVWDLHLVTFSGSVILTAGAYRLALDPGEARMLAGWLKHAAGAAKAFDLLVAAGVRERAAGQAQAAAAAGVN